MGGDNRREGAKGMFQEDLAFSISKPGEDPFPGGGQYSVRRSATQGWQRIQIEKPERLGGGGPDQ